MKGLQGVSVCTPCYVSVTSFNESINVKTKVIALAVLSLYTLANIASLSDYGSLSP